MSEGRKIFYSVETLSNFIVDSRKAGKS